MSEAEKLAEKFSIPGNGIADMDLFQRYEVLEKLGMLPHEDNIGHPERPYHEWSKEEIELAVNIFQTWPKFKETEAMFDRLADGFTRHFRSRSAGLDLKDRVGLVHATADALNIACKEIWGDSFPEIAIREKNMGKERILPSGGKAIKIGGLAPDNTIEINIDVLTYNSEMPRRYEGDFSHHGDAAFIEFCAHEVVHLIQKFSSIMSDGETQDARLSARVAESFYESVAFARGEDLGDLYWHHPFESDARRFANLVTACLLKHAAEIRFDNNGAMA